MGIKYGIGNGNGRLWETTSMGMEITCTPIGIYSHRFYAAACSKLIKLSLGPLATCQKPMPFMPSLPTT